jgi:hypothetical protein
VEPASDPDGAPRAAAMFSCPICTNFEVPKSFDLYRVETLPEGSKAWLKSAIQKRSRSERVDPFILDESTILLARTKSGPEY